MVCKNRLSYGTTREASFPVYATENIHPYVHVHVYLTEGIDLTFRL